VYGYGNIAKCSVPFISRVTKWLIFPYPVTYRAAFFEKKIKSKNKFKLFNQERQIIFHSAVISLGPWSIYGVGMEKI